MGMVDVGVASTIKGDSVEIELSYGDNVPR